MTDYQFMYEQLVRERAELTAHLQGEIADKRMTLRELWDALVKERDSLKAERDAADARLIAHNNTARQELRFLLDIRDKLLAERDELRACVATLVDMLPSCDVQDRTHVPSGCYLCRARALVRP